MQRMTTAAPSLEATSLRHLAVLELLRGRPDKARAMLADARQVVADLGLRHGLMETELFAGIIELMEGDAAAAEPHFRTALEGFKALGVGADAGQAAALLARTVLAQGRIDEADRYAAESERLAGPQPEDGHRMARRASRDSGGAGSAQGRRRVGPRRCCRGRGHRPGARPCRRVPGVAPRARGGRRLQGRHQCSLQCRSVVYRQGSGRQNRPGDRSRVGADDVDICGHGDEPDGVAASCRRIESSETAAPYFRALQARMDIGGALSYFSDEVRLRRSSTTRWRDPIVRSRRDTTDASSASWSNSLTSSFASWRSVVSVLI